MRLRACSFALLFTVAVAAAAEAAVTLWDPARAPEPLTLENGLTVAILPWEGLPLVEVRVFYPSSPGTEPPGKEGISHLARHMLSSSAPGFPHGGLLRELRLATCSYGGNTFSDHTRFDATCPPSHLRRVLEAEAARMQGAPPDPVELERERSIVLEEIAYRGHYAPFTALARAVQTACFPNHPFGRSPDGTREGVESVTEQDLRDYLADNHGPSGAVLVIVGEVDPDSVRTTVTEVFGPVPAGGAGRPDVDPAAPGGGAIVRLDRWDMEGYSIALGFRLPREGRHDGVLAAFARELLRETVREVRTDFLNNEYVVVCGGNYIYPTIEWTGDPIDPDADRTERESHRYRWTAINEAIAGLDQPTFERFLERVRIEHAENLRDPDHVARWTGLSILKGRKLIVGPASIDSAAAELTLDKVRDYLRRQVQADRAVFGISHGRDSGRLVDIPSPAHVGNAEDDVSGALPGHTLDPAAVQEALNGYRRLGIRIRSEATGNDLPVHRVEVPGAPWTMALACQSFAPLKSEKEGKHRGSVRAYEWLLRRSVSKRDSAEVSPPLIRVDMEVSARTVSARNRSRDTDASVLALSEVLRGERTDVDEWKRVQRSLKGSWESDDRSAWVRASRSRWSALFGSEHPLLGSFSPGGEAAARVLYKNVAEMEKELARGEGLQVFLVGDPEGVGAVDTGAAALQRLEARPRKKRIVPETRLDGETGEVVPDFQKQDVEIRLSFPPAEQGHEGDPGWAAAELGREIAWRRLHDRLREELGLVYRVGILDRPAGDAVVMEILTSGLPSDAPQVFEELCRGVARLAEDGFTDAELDQARLARVCRVALWWKEPVRVEGALRDLARHGPPPENPVEALMSASAEDVAGSLRAWLRPDRFAFSIVGPLLEEDLSRFAQANDG